MLYHLCKSYISKIEKSFFPCPSWDSALLTTRVFFTPISYSSKMFPPPPHFPYTIMNKSHYIHNISADGFIQMSLNCNLMLSFHSILLSEVYLFSHISQSKRKGWHSPIAMSKPGLSHYFLMVCSPLRRLKLFSTTSASTSLLPSLNSLCIY